MSDDMFPFEEKAHYHLFEIQVALAAIAAHTNDQQPAKFLVDKQGNNISLPYLPLTLGQHSRTLATKLLRDITGIGDEWTALTQCGFIDTKQEHQVVLYGVMLPHSVPLKQETLQWITFDELQKSIDVYKLFSVAIGHTSIGV